MRAIHLEKPVHLSVVEETLDAGVDVQSEDNETQQLLLDMVGFVDSLEDQYLTIEPWFIFHAWLDYRFEPMAKCHNIFRAWQLFHWAPHPSTVKDPMFNDDVKTIADAYLERCRGRLSQNQITLVKACQAQQLDLYEVIATVGSRILLYGLIGRKKVTVFSPSLSSRATRGEYVLANVLPVEGTHIFLGVSDLLPKESKPAVTEFCQFIERCDTTVPREFKSFESEVFNLFYDLTQDI